MIKKKNDTSPEFAARLLKEMVSFSISEGTVGDFAEEYMWISEEKGRFTAWIWYWMQIVQMIPSFTLNSIKWSTEMFKNYFKIVLRNSVRQKGYSFINIAGLATGMTCCILIMLWVLDELSYDRFHEHVKNLYRVETDMQYSGELLHVNYTQFPAGPAYKEEIPEVINSARYMRLDNMLMRYKDKSFHENRIRAADPSFFVMFTFPFVQGDKNTVLNEPNSMVISEEIAYRYFGDENPVGKLVSINNRHEFTISGVIKNVPHNSSLQFDIVVPLDFTREIGQYFTSWGMNALFTYVQLRENSILPEVDEKINTIFKNNTTNLEWEYRAAPVREMHLHSYGFGKETGDIKYVYIFSVVAIFILLIACINFMNLSTARSANRAKEIGMRKVVGAQRKNIISQFFSESVILSFIAFLLALLFVILLLPKFNTLSGKEISLNIFGNILFFSGLLCITFVTAIIAGSYPALFISAFKPIKALKGEIISGAKGSYFRKALVVLQFTISIFLIIGTAVVLKQLTYIKDMKLGYDREHLVYLTMSGDAKTYFRTLKEELVKSPNILNVTGTQQLPSNLFFSYDNADWDGKDPEKYYIIGLNSVDFDFTETLDMKITEGRGFSREFTSETGESFLVNEVMANLMEKKSVVGERFSFVGITGTIVGVVENFHYRSVKEEIGPMVLVLAPERFLEYALVRIQPGNIASSIDFIKKTWEKVIPDYPFDYNFLDVEFDKLYRAEENMSNIFKYFSILAIVIACLGLFGLSSFTAEKKTREIGIRKVLGASVPGIVVLLSKEFIKWVLIANIVAWPLSYFAMTRWLQDFAYSTDLNIYIFVLAAVLSFIIALFTVSFQAIKAAFSKPVEALRSE